MSKQFSLRSWVARVPSVQSIITSTRRKRIAYDDFYEDVVYQYDPNPHYYAMAEDWAGHHCPYPLLPRWAQRLFDWRVARARRYGQRLRVRGLNWWFHCPTPGCEGESFFSYRAHRCWSCGWYFDKDLVAVNRSGAVPAPATRLPAACQAAVAEVSGDAPDDMPF